MFYLLDVALLFLLIVSLVGFGWCTLGRGSGLLEASVLPGAALLGIWSFLTWSIGSAGFYAPKISALGYCVFVLIYCVVRWKNGRDIGIKLRCNWRWPRGSSLVLALYLVAASLFTLALTLAPPTGLDYDSLVYHLAVPAQYERMGRVAQLAYDHHSYFPLTVEMLFGIAMSVRDAVFAKLIHWLMLPLCALALVGIGKRLHSWRAGLLAAVLFVSMPMALGEATTAYIDLGFTAFALLAIWCFLGAPFRIEQLAPSSLIWSGLFCGLCLGSKYFGALIFGFLGLWLLFEWRRSPERRASLGLTLAAFVLPALLLGAPWYIRNWLWSGNPVYPFAYGIFGGRGWTKAMAVAYDADQARFGFSRGLLDLLLLPWHLATTPLSATVVNGAVKGQTLWPLLDSPAPEPKSGIFDVPVPSVFLQTFPGPAIIALGFLGWLAPRKNRLTGGVAWFVGFLLLFWFVSSQQIRYLFPTLGLLALLGGVAGARFSNRLPVTRWVATGALALWGALALAVTWHRLDLVLPVVTGQEQPEAYLARTFSGWPAMQWLNTQTPAGARIAVYGEPRCFYLQRDYFWADQQHNLLVPYDQITSGRQLAAQLKRLGATYILWNSAAGQNGGVFGPPQPIFDQMVESGQADLLTDERGYRIYRLNGG